MTDYDVKTVRAVTMVAEAVKGTLKPEDAFLVGLAVGTRVQRSSPVIGEEVYRLVVASAVAGGREKEGIVSTIQELTDKIAG